MIYKLPNTIYYMGRKFLLKKEQIGTWWKVNYAMLTNSEHEYSSMLFLPPKRQTRRELKDDDICIIPMSVIKNTLEGAEKMLLDRLNNLDQNLFTWK